MSAQNPAARPTLEDKTLKNVRLGQRCIVFAVFFNFIAMIALLAAQSGVVTGFILLIGMIASIILGIVGVVRLTVGLGYGILAVILFTLGLFIPLVSLIILIILSTKATRLLTSAGYKVGLFGASWKPKTS